MAEVILTLFAANAVILFVMAAAFRFAGRGRGDQPYWNSWVVANLVLGAALVVFIFEPRLSGPLVDVVPNGLLLAGFGLRWRAAREFGHRRSSPFIVWGAVGVFAAFCFLPPFAASYTLVYTSANILLAAFAFATAWEFWRDRADGLPSRYGLVAAYSIIALSFSVRVGQGLFASSAFGQHLPQDLMLVIHLWVALVHIPAAGAFALSLAYERGAAELGYKATHDSLTGLLNRGAFEHLLRQHIARAGQEPFAVALFDIDHFKAINDEYGHAAGDAAIRDCAETITATLGEDATAARIGGEEFAVLLPGLPPGPSCAAAERVRRAVGARIVRTGDRYLTMTVSAGLSHSAGGGRQFDEMMRIADDGLYAAKNAGRDRVEGFAA